MEHNKEFTDFDMYGQIDVLDHGYVRLIESWGGGDADVPEAAIIEAARQSTQGSFRGWEEDERLLGFLLKNKHMTPFEFCGMTLEIQAPIFVFREWHRHRTQSYNEMSARYSPLPDVNYVPTKERLFLTQEKNKQAGKAVDIELTDTAAMAFMYAVEKLYEESEKIYKVGLSTGIPKELARVVLPVGRYSRMRASTDLRNWLQFLTLRLHPAAQWEIRQYAEAVKVILKQEFPKTVELFEDNGF